MQNEKPRTQDEIPRPGHDLPTVPPERPTKDYPIPADREPNVEAPWPDSDTGVLISPEPWDVPREPSDGNGSG